MHKKARGKASRAALGDVRTCVRVCERVVGVVYTLKRILHFKGLAVSPL